MLLVVLHLSVKKGLTVFQNFLLSVTSFIRKNIFPCLFSVHNTASLSRHEQVCLIRLRFERHFSHHRASSMMGEISLET